MARDEGPRAYIDRLIREADAFEIADVMVELHAEQKRYREGSRNWRDLDRRIERLAARFRELTK